MRNEILIEGTTSAASATFYLSGEQIPATVSLQGGQGVYHGHCASITAQVMSLTLFPTEALLAMLGSGRYTDEQIRRELIRRAIYT
jgi:hypothetical protein